MRFLRAFSGKWHIFAMLTLCGTAWLASPVCVAGPRPKPQDPVNTSPQSIDNPANKPPDYMKYTPYNDGHLDLDLWRLETRKFFRSRPVLSPDKSAMAYTEVIFMPGARQTFSKLYLVPVPPPPDPLPSRDANGNPVKPSPQYASLQQARFNPDKLLKQRVSIHGAGHDHTADFEFLTLTIVDWSNSGRRLLFKQRNGILHIGLRTSDILVYDMSDGTVTIYPEIRRALTYFWNDRDPLPKWNRMAWDIIPLGWQVGSDNLVLFKAWALDGKTPRFLGLWQYDVDAKRTQLLDLRNVDFPYAANGIVPEPQPIPSR